MPRVFLRCVLTVFLLCAAAVSAAEGGALARAVAKVLADKKYAHVRVGVHVTAVGSGRVIFVRNANELYIPASNQKLLVAFAALQTLGAEHKFRTTLHAVGGVADGVLAGDLLVRGGGDPTIGGYYPHDDGEAVLRKWAAALKAGGLVRITGDVVADGSAFDSIVRHPSWLAKEAWMYYCPTTGALALNGNCVAVTALPGKTVGAPLICKLSPAVAPVKLAVVGKTSSKTNAVWFDRKPGADTIRVGGFLKRGGRGFTGPVTAPDPELYFATVLRATLVAEGVAVGGIARRVKEAEKVLHHTARKLHRNATNVAPVLRTMLQESNNHYAEQVLKTIGAAGGKTGSWESGRKQIGVALQALGVKAGEYVIDDGSGLSRKNRVSPAVLTSVLGRIHSGNNRKLFLTLLAVSGTSGTLKNRLTDKLCKGKVLAKTGYMRRVGALSGYARTKSGIGVCFSILVNSTKQSGDNYQKRPLLDAICRAIVQHAR
jgi:serine-type D-Ala-D-Ala carboxypeptidase/endopeptidase (penicillin-binding protein 4)